MKTSIFYKVVVIVIAIISLLSITVCNASDNDITNNVSIENNAIIISSDFETCSATIVDSFEINVDSNIVSIYQNNKESIYSIFNFETTYSNVGGIKTKQRIQVVARDKIYIEFMMKNKCVSEFELDLTKIYDIKTYSSQTGYYVKFKTTNAKIITLKTKKSVTQSQILKALNNLQ